MVWRRRARDHRPGFRGAMMQAAARCAGMGLRAGFERIATRISRCAAPSPGSGCSGFAPRQAPAFAPDYCAGSRATMRGWTPSSQGAVLSSSNDAPLAGLKVSVEQVVGALTGV